ncbi:class I SAM-dependent methyltransferase [Pseudomonas sp. UM16]|uniref:class I SAM-dependent methyltransferase n=1 Tax=Pseudomonas sp. UM16 TaxID=3158962 RepID=UPI00398FA335
MNSETEFNNADRSSNWKTYYDHHEGRPASVLLRAALHLVDTDTPIRQAIDLGCGAGNDTRFLLDSGWNVLAVDREDNAINLVKARGRGFPEGQLCAVAQAFECLHPLPSSSLIFAGMALPFCHREHFADFWSNILSTLEPGGVFAGNLFGDRDDWADRTFMNFHSEAQARALFQGLDLHLFQVHEEDGPCMRGFKHWHRFDFIAKKPIARA